MQRCHRRMGTLLAITGGLCLSACGGGGAGSSGGGPTLGTPGTQALAQQCSPNNPYRADATSSTRTGSLTTEKQWVASYLNDAYLWYRDIPTVDASQAAYSNEQDVYDSLNAYFQALKSPLLTASGARKDRFSFIYPTKQWNQESQAGVQLSTGARWLVGSRTPPRNIQVAYVEPGSSAATAGVQRGDTLVSVDGVSADDPTSNGVAILNALLSPSTTTSRNVVFRRVDGSTLNTVLTPANLTTQPVLVTRTFNVGGQRVGYLVFNSHTAASEAPLVAAFSQFQVQGVSDLVLDLRYNGGGYLQIAAQVGYMIAGSRSVGQVFQQLQFNDKRAADTAASVNRFYTTTCQFDANFRCTQSQPLPTLNLSRVFILASGSTCSASEAIINGLRGIDLDVRLIGTTTCGKPYGFYARDNCGVSYFPIEFQGANAKGASNYADGFSPACMAPDDLGHALGDPAEGMLATALANIGGQGCRLTAQSVGQRPATQPELVRAIWEDKAFRLPNP